MDKNKEFKLNNVSNIEYISFKLIGYKVRAFLNIIEFNYKLQIKFIKNSNLNYLYNQTGF